MDKTDGFQPEQHAFTETSILHQSQNPSQGLPSDHQDATQVFTTEDHDQNGKHYPQYSNQYYPIDGPIIANTGGPVVPISIIPTPAPRNLSKPIYEPFDVNFHRFFDIKSAEEHWDQRQQVDLSIAVHHPEWVMWETWPYCAPRIANLFNAMTVVDPNVVRETKSAAYQQMRDMKYSRDEIEAACWRILHALGKRHITGPLVKIHQINRGSAKDKRLKLTERFAAIIDGLTRCKIICQDAIKNNKIELFVHHPIDTLKTKETNRNGNATRGAALELGKIELTKKSTTTNKMGRSVKRQRASSSSTPVQTPNITRAKTNELELQLDPAIFTTRTVPNHESARVPCYRPIQAFLPPPTPSDQAFHTRPSLNLQAGYNYGMHSDGYAPTTQMTNGGFNAPAFPEVYNPFAVPAHPELAPIRSTLAPELGLAQHPNMNAANTRVNFGRDGLFVEQMEGEDDEGMEH